VSLGAQLDPALWPAYASSAFAVARRRLRGPRRFSGDAGQICRAIVDACWTGEYLAASGGHFRQAWTRDLGFAAPSLVRLGVEERVRASLAWMLDAWAPGGRVTTTIFPGRRPRDVWTMGIDSLPLLLLSLQVSGSDDLVRRHGVWLAPEVARFANEAVDPTSGLVVDDRSFSTHRDTVRTRSNAYANVMALLLDRVLRETSWFRSPIPPGTVDRFVERFWRGDRFVDRVDGGTVTGDATVAPFFFGIVPDDLGLVAALRAASAAGLADPLPLRYAAVRDRSIEDPRQARLVPDYQGTAIWTSLGAMYLCLLERAAPADARPVIDAYRAFIEREGTVWEVLDGASADLRPYRGTMGLFVADEAMLWAAILAETLGGPAWSGQAGGAGDGDQDDRHDEAQQQ
jgi:hypothetical protein